MTAWQARVEYNVVTDTDDVTIWARSGDDHVDLVTVASVDATPTIIRSSRTVTIPEPVAIKLPRGAADAIALAVAGTSSDTLAALGEALDIERRRVDLVLERLTGPSKAADSDGGPS